MKEEVKTQDTKIRDLGEAKELVLREWQDLQEAKDSEEQRFRKNERIDELARRSDEQAESEYFALEDASNFRLEQYDDDFRDTWRDYIADEIKPKLIEELQKEGRGDIIEFLKRFGHI